MSALLESPSVGRGLALVHHILAVVLLDFLGIRSVPAQEPGTRVEGTRGVIIKMESFDRDPHWEGVNNRSARSHQPRMVRQDFGFNRATHHAGGHSPGEMGGFVSPAAEAAFYGKIIDAKTLRDPLTAKGKILVGRGSTHLLLGFFNANTVNEWRAPNTIALRINGRGDKFFAYVEYCTARWRAGGDTTPFPSLVDSKSGRSRLIGFLCETSLDWSLTYEPGGVGESGVVTAKIGEATAVCTLEPSHKLDGATFNRFGIINVLKSADSGSEVWLDDIAVNGGPIETFANDPHWDGRNNRRTAPTRNVRPWFDFGFSDTHLAGGRFPGELGGQMFRGDCRYVDRMACYGDRVGPLSLDKPLKASGTIAMTRGVSDSTTLFGFYNSRDSMRPNKSQDDAVPESVLGIHIEGPSSDGFHFYPVLRPTGGGRSRIGRVREFPAILPDGKSHRWSLQYNPAGAKGNGQIVVELDDASNVVDLRRDAKTRRTSFDRFGIVTSWIDGNSQNVYLDDLTYTAGQE